MRREDASFDRAAQAFGDAGEALGGFLVAFVAALWATLWAVLWKMEPLANRASGRFGVLADVFGDVRAIRRQPQLADSAQRQEQELDVESGLLVASEAADNGATALVVAARNAAALEAALPCETPKGEAADAGATALEAAARNAATLEAALPCEAPQTEADQSEDAASLAARLSTVSNAAPLISVLVVDDSTPAELVTEAPSTVLPTTSANTASLGAVASTPTAVARNVEPKCLEFFVGTPPSSPPESSDESLPEVKSMCQKEQPPATLPLAGQLARAAMHRLVEEERLKKMADLKEMQTLDDPSARSVEPLLAHLPTPSRSHEDSTSHHSDRHLLPAHGSRLAAHCSTHHADAGKVHRLSPPTSQKATSRNSSGQRSCAHSTVGNSAPTSRSPSGRSLHSTWSSGQRNHPHSTSTTSTAASRSPSGRPLHSACSRSSSGGISTERRRASFAPGVRSRPSSPGQTTANAAHSAGHRTRGLVGHGSVGGSACTVNAAAPRWR